MGKEYVVVENRINALFVGAKNECEKFVQEYMKESDNEDPMTCGLKDEPEVKEKDTWANNRYYVYNTESGYVSYSDISLTEATELKKKINEEAMIEKSPTYEIGEDRRNIGA